MEYKTREVVYVEVKDLTRSEYSELHEFLRVQMIVPFLRQEGFMEPSGESEKKATFSGCFDLVSAEKVKEWLDERKCTETAFTQICFGC